MRFVIRWLINAVALYLTTLIIHGVQVTSFGGAVLAALVLGIVNAVIRPNEDRASIVSFDTAPELVADLTDDTEKLKNAIKSLRPGGGTALYDAIFFACRDKLMQDQPRHKFRRAMVILSDGEDNQSRYTRDQALEMAHKADVVIYSISTNRTGMEGDGDKIMKYFAEQTGGLRVRRKVYVAIAKPFHGLPSRRHCVRPVGVDQKMNPH